MTEVRRELGLTQTQVYELQRTLRSPEHPMTAALAELGVAYRSPGRGRQARSCLVKAG